MKKNEKILLCLFIILAVCVLFHILPPWSLMLGGFFIAFFYALCSVILINDIRLKNALESDSYKGISGMRIFGSVVIGILHAHILISILFAVLAWPGARINMILVFFYCALPMLISAIKYRKSKSIIYKRILVRTLSLLLLLVFFNILAYNLK